MLLLSHSDGSCIAASLKLHFLECRYSTMPAELRPVILGTGGTLYFCCGQLGLSLSSLVVPEGQDFHLVSGRSRKMSLVQLVQVESPHNSPDHGSA